MTSALRATVLFCVWPLLAASPEACGSCHREEVAKFARAGMTRALVAGVNSEILQAHPRLTANIGGYTYEIARTNHEATYTVTDGKETLRIKIAWAFGQGTAGQTYLFERSGRWYESRVSYFSALNGLDVTIGQQDILPHNLLEAAGRLTSAVEARACFDCHAANVKRTMPLNLAGMVEGVQCERCHGVSEAHRRDQAPMKSLRELTTEEMSDFCGQCHRTWSQIAANGPRGVQNVRFQPYRLGISKCYDAADRRIRCTACHDPHSAVEASTRAYDAKCLACHAQGKVCKTATKDCVTCHMPQIALPGAHKSFTDHKIRVVKAGEVYPD